MRLVRRPVLAELVAVEPDDLVALRRDDAGAFDLLPLVRRLRRVVAHVPASEVHIFVAGVVEFHPVESLEARLRAERDAVLRHHLVDRDRGGDVDGRRTSRRRQRHVVVHDKRHRRDVERPSCLRRERHGYGRSLLHDVAAFPVRLHLDARHLHGRHGDMRQLGQRERFKDHRHVRIGRGGKRRDVAHAGVGHTSRHLGRVANLQPGLASGGQHRPVHAVPRVRAPLVFLDGNHEFDLFVAFRHRAGERHPHVAFAGGVLDDAAVVRDVVLVYKHRHAAACSGVDFRKIVRCGERDNCRERQLGGIRRLVHGRIEGEGRARRLGVYLQEIVHERGVRGSHPCALAFDDLVRPVNGPGRETGDAGIEPLPRPCRCGKEENARKHVREFHRRGFHFHFRSPLGPFHLP